MKKSELLDAGFKKKMINKQLYFINDDIVLKFISYDNVINESKLFINKPNESFHDIYDVIKLLIYNSFLNLSEKFKNGLPEENLKQGNFKEAFIKPNNYTFEYLDYKKAELLCEAIFNYLISSNLMQTTSNSGTLPNFDYKIIDCTITCNKSGEVDVLNFNYHYKNTKGSHDFYKTASLLNSIKEIYDLWHPCYNYLTIEHFITHFTNKPLEQ